MRIPRRFTSNLKSPYEGIRFTQRKSEIREPDGRVVFSQENISVPDTWSQVATDILAQKYFRRTGVPDPKTGEKKGENDSRQVFHRMVGCWTGWGQSHGYFSSDEDARHFYDEVCYMLAHQMAAPNSPQWFNTGLHFAYGIDGPAQGHFYVEPTTGEVKASESAYAHPQPSACFIQGVEDDLVGDGGVMDLWVREARLFKYGSGSGTNFSRIRSDGEKLSGGGRSSGLMSFLKVGDRAAGAIKSGGTTRRAAKMVCLDLDHPEIEEFILWKAKEEEKVSALVAGSILQKRCLEKIFKAAFVDDKPLTDPKENDRLKIALKEAKQFAVPMGAIGRVIDLAKQGDRDLDLSTFDVDWQGEAYQTVSGQNSNNSVRIPNAFFEAIEKNSWWPLRYRTDGKVAKEISARELWDKIGYAAWASADPGVQCDTTINEWHTCPEGGRINASNPCSEYMFLDDTACNLASINLIKFYDEKSGEFDVEGFEHACRLWTVVLEISVLMAQFPSRAIALRSYEYRTLGLGYANLGALLMSMGISYGSKPALGITGALTALMTGASYRTSAEMAGELGAFPRYKENRMPMLRVIENHRRAAYAARPEEYQGLSVTPHPLIEDGVSENLLKRARESWDEALDLGKKYGFRNAQVTVVAPTGTIGLVMDCDTTGIEPDFSLVKFKKLAGGGYFRIINQSVPRALGRLGYTPTEIREVIGYCSGFASLEESPHINLKTLREKGVSEQHLAKLQKELPHAFSLELAYTQVVGSSLNDLGFSESEIAAANRHITGTLTIEGAPHLKTEHYPVFDCANPCGTLGRRSLHYMSHVDTLAAAQSFISGAISKTVNMPSSVSIKDVQAAYLTAWQKGVKAISIYRDGSKLSQPLQASWADVLTTSDEMAEEKPEVIQVAQAMARRAMRRELPSRRFGYTVKATIGGQKVYLRTGEYEDGGLGEIFVDMYKEGAAYRSLMNAFAIAVSVGLQYGVPLEEYLQKFHMFRFEPNGHVADHDNVKFCSSIIDFIFRDLAMNYLGRTDLVHVPPKAQLEQASYAMSGGASGGMQMGSSGGGGGTSSQDTWLTQEEWSDDHAFASKMAKTQGYEGDPCSDCGQFTMVRSGTCVRCVSCGTTSGCS